MRIRSWSGQRPGFRCNGCAGPAGRASVGPMQPVSATRNANSNRNSNAANNRARPMRDCNQA